MRGGPAAQGACEESLNTGELCAPSHVTYRSPLIPLPATVAAKCKYTIESLDFEVKHQYFQNLN